MNVASLELCRELYELSGWNDVSDMWGAYEIKEELNEPMQYIPKYDTGYLLRKLPLSLTYERIVYYLHIGEAITEDPAEMWQFDYRTINDGQFCAATGTSPEDALAKICVKLFHQGILTKQGTTNE